MTKRTRNIFDAQKGIFSDLAPYAMPPPFFPPMKKLLLILPVLMLAACAPSQNAMSDDPRIAAVQTMLIGRWSSEEDRNFEREYRAEGTVVDFYMINMTGNGGMRFGKLATGAEMRDGIED